MIAIASRRAGAAVWTLLALSSISTTVTAQPSAPARHKPAAHPAPTAAATGGLSTTLTGPAKADYDAGKILFADGDMPGAIVKFQSAYDASKDPRLLWNMAACEKNLRRYARVLSLIERYKSEAARILTPQDVKEAEELIAALAPFVGSLRLVANEDGASVYIDDELVGTTPLGRAPTVDLGPHRIRVVKAGFREHATTQNVAGAEDVKVHVTLVREVHEGRLSVVAGANDTISVDGKVVGVGKWDAPLPSGGHALRVSAPGMKTDARDVLVLDDQTRVVHLTLEAEPRPASTGIGAGVWALIVGGGAALAAGVVVGVVLLAKSDTPPRRDAVPGTISPGTVQLPLGR